MSNESEEHVRNKLQIDDDAYIEEVAPGTFNICMRSETAEVDRATMILLMGAAGSAFQCGVDESTSYLLDE